MGNKEKMNGDTPYYVMFGPGICGPGTKKVHVIFSYKGKNLLTKKDIRCKDDELTHLYTLILNSDNPYEVRIDGSKVESGKLEDDWDFLAPKTIPDPEAKKPEDWDDEEDGDWEPAMINNPAHKGEWKAKQIDNPAYKGEWVHPEIPNPDYVADSAIYKYDNIGHVGFEIWQVKSGTIFDNILVTDSIADAEAHAKETFEKTKVGEKKMKDEADEKERKEEEEREAKRKAEEDAKKPEDKKDDKEEDKDEEEEEEEEEKEDKPTADETEEEAATPKDEL